MSSADLFEDGIPHGTREGYAKGCHGGACPEAVEGRRTCRDANMAYAGDQVYRHRVNAGMTPVQIAEQEAEDRAVEKIAGAGQRPAGKPVKPAAPSKPVVSLAPVSALQAKTEPASPPPFEYTEAEVARMVELHQQGKNDSAIARELGRSQPQVSKRLRRMEASRRASKAEEDLVQLHLKRDVELSAVAREPSGAELVTSPSAPVAIVQDEQPAGFAGLGLDIDPTNAGGVRVRLHGAQPIQLDLQFTDGALRDVGVKIGA